MVAGDIDAALAIEQQLSPDPWRRYAFEQSLASHRAAVVVDSQQQLAGFALWSVVADQAELLNIALHRNHHGRGFGRLLLQSLIDQLPSSVSTLFLEVRVSNFAAIALYNRCGFNQIGERRDYYRSSSAANAGREDALVMALQRL